MFGDVFGDCSLLKMLTPYDEKTIKEMLELGMEEYEKNKKTVY